MGEREARIDRAVRQGLWDVSAFGAPAEIRRMMQAVLESGLGDRWRRAILGRWAIP